MTKIFLCSRKIRKKHPRKSYCLKKISYAFLEVWCTPQIQVYLFLEQDISNSQRLFSLMQGLEGFKTCMFICGLELYKFFMTTKCKPFRTLRLNMIVEITVDKIMCQKWNYEFCIDFRNFCIECLNDREDLLWVLKCSFLSTFFASNNS